MEKVNTPPPKEEKKKQIWLKMFSVKIFFELAILYDLFLKQYKQTNMQNTS